MKNIKNIILAFITLIILGVIYWSTYTFAEPKAYDFMTKNVLINKLPFDNHKKNSASDDINLIVIDNNATEKYKWPWKREMYCEFFEYLYEYAQPKLIVYDSLILSHDIYNPNSDRKFFDCIKKFDNLIVGFRLKSSDWQDEDFGKLYTDNFAKKFALKNIEYKSHKQEYDLYYSLAQFPKEYIDSVKSVGSVSIIQGHIDGILEDYIKHDTFRTNTNVVRYAGKLYPSLAFGAFLKMHDYPKVIVYDKYIYLPEINRKIPQNTTRFQAVTPIKFYKINDDGYCHKKYSALDIMDSYRLIKQGKKPIINPKEFKDKIVFIGANVTIGAGLDDNLSTPVKSYFPGLEYQATAADNLLHNDFLKVIPAWANVLIAILSMLIIYGIIRMYDIYKAILLTFTTVFLYLLICTACFYYSVVINVITPIVMIVLTMIGAYIHRYLTESRTKEKVKTAMSKYMSEDVMKSVLENIDNLGLGGKKAEVTVLFSDIRGFTSMSETMPAQQVSEILNEYFSEMEPIVRKYNGIINKFIGDAVMAIFGEPIQDSNHPSNAVKCGYEMLLKVQELQTKWAEEGKPEIEIGIGINTGEVFVGNIGSENRMEYTVIGDTVNLASRLESYNKTFKTKMLISSSTYEKSKHCVEVNKISDVEIRGKSQKLDIYEIKKVFE